MRQSSDEKRQRLSCSYAGLVTEIGQLNTGDTVQIEGECSGSYIYVYSPKYGTSGWVNAGFLG